MNNFAAALSQLIPVARSQGLKASQPLPNANKGNDFRIALKEKMEDENSLHFSKHASARLNDRQIELSENDLQRLERATDKASAKGAKEALMMLDNLNFIVSVNNRTVVTAMQTGEVEDKVYTNIDTAVIVGDLET